MRNKGFTLPEVLITLGVIGIIAAITFPSINRVSPDKDKGMVLKAYRSITYINNEIFSDTSLYMPDSECTESGNNMAVNILRCTNRPLDTDSAYDDYIGADKYPFLLRDKLTLTDTLQKSGSNYTFATTDGISWTITAKDVSTDLNYDIIINTGNSKRSNCIYDKTTCKNPREFKFNLDKNGHLYGVDSLTKAYLMNPAKLNTRSEDLDTAYNMD